MFHDVFVIAIVGVFIVVLVLLIFWGLMRLGE